MAHVFVVVSYTGTVVSRLIRARWPEGAFSHSSISLDPELRRMYSFGRRGTYNMLNAGFVQEAPEKGLYARKPVEVRIYRLEVSDEAYAMLEAFIDGFIGHEEELHYDALGLALKLVRPRFELCRDDHYYCSRFVAEALLESGACERLPARPRLMHPTMFADVEGAELVYEGLLSEYRPSLGLTAADPVRGVPRRRVLTRLLERARRHPRLQ